MPLALNLKPGSLAALSSLVPEFAPAALLSDNGLSVHFCPPPGFAARPPRRCYPVAALLFPSFVEAAPAALERIDGVSALRRLIEGGSLLPRPLRPDAVAELVDWLQSVPAYSLRFSNLTEACASVRRLLACL